ncbi:DUF3047 domain-containing protein [Candidatus Pelagibacter sp.]|uniref:DUF3047 domain-containing protein n=1 Tax=Candidatus Pelagibacter sp. TaxID=2024849 RepID=UPI003F8466DC
MFKKILLVFGLLFLSSPSYGEVIKVFEFTESELSNLEEKKVRGAKNKTIFSVGNNDNGNFLKAVSSNGGSGIGKEIEIDLEKTPFLNITWKVEKDLSGIDEKSKKGHDFAARMFVVKKTGATPLSNRAINFVFSSNEDVNKFWPSPYFSKSIDYVLSSTKEHLNEWVSAKVNVKELFKQLHDLDLKNLDGVALMADTDNSKLNSVAYYQDIFFSAE